MHVVTGGAGFIGSVIVSKLNDEGIDDILIVDSLSTSTKWKNLLGKKYRDYIHKSQFLEHLHAGRFTGQISSVIHMGACSSTTETDADYFMENNYKYTRALAEYCLESGIRFIYASSAATYGDGNLGYSDKDEDQEKLRPLNRYGYSKQLFDLWALRNNVADQIVGLKFFNVYGPNEYHKGTMRSVVNHSYYSIKEKGEANLFRSYRDDYNDGEQKRDFIYVKDCANIAWWLLQNKEVNGIFNLGTGSARTWKDLVHAVFSALGIEPKINFIDMPDNLINQYQYFTQADMEKLKATGCPLPKYSLEEGVKDYVQNYMEQPFAYE